jgi:hypothetical protein
MATRNEPEDDTALAHWPPRLRVLVGADADGHPLKLRFEGLSPNGKPFKSEPVDVHHTEWFEYSQDFNVMENETLRWRVTIDDGLETTSSSWQRLHRNEIAEAPLPPALLVPGDNAQGYDETLMFSWSLVDPDPQEELAVFFEWRTAQSDWQNQLATSATTHLWPGPTEDSVLEWRMRATDSTGHEVWTAPRTLTLQRHWSAELRVATRHATSLPLRIGARPGARDAFVNGEDTIAPSSISQPEILSRAPQPAAGKPLVVDGDRLVDIRRPRAPAAGKLDNFYDIRIRGTAGALLELQATALSLPPLWSLVWQANKEHGHIADRTALTPENSIPIRLDARGEASGLVFVQMARENGNEDQHNDGPDGRGTVPKDRLHGNHPSVLASHNTSVVSLQMHLALLANPLTTGVRLLPPGLD